MYKKYFIVPILVLIAGCYHKPKTYLHVDTTQVQKDTLIGASQLIVPGKSIGDTYIGESLDSVITRLGKPDQSDAAMGSSLSTWFAKHDSTAAQTDIFSHHNYGAKDESVSRVKLVRVTSPWFKTSEYIHNGMPLDSITIHYHLKHVADYSSAKDTLKIYDDVAQGIAFEINNQHKCAGILIHAAKDSTGTYISMHPHMTYNKVQ